MDTFGCSAPYTAGQQWLPVCDVDNSKQRQGSRCSVSPSTSLTLHIWMCSCGRHLSEEHHAPVSFCMLPLFVMMSLIVGSEQWRGYGLSALEDSLVLTSSMWHTGSLAAVFSQEKNIPQILLCWFSSRAHRCSLLARHGPPSYRVKMSGEGEQIGGEAERKRTLYSELGHYLRLDVGASCTNVSCCFLLLIGDITPLHPHFDPMCL